MNLPPIQRRMLDLLADGIVHTHDQLRHCADDPDMINGTLYVNIKKLKDELRKYTSFDIVSYRGEGYRLVRLIMD